MIVRSTFILVLLFLHTLNALNPAYLQQYLQEQALMENINKQLNDQHSNFDSPEINEDDDQLVKRNKYTNFRVSPLWLSRRTRNNRFYGKPLWISRTG